VNLLGATTGWMSMGTPPLQQFPAPARGIMLAATKLAAAIRAGGRGRGLGRGPGQSYDDPVVVAEWFTTFGAAGTVLRPLWMRDEVLHAVRSTPARTSKSTRSAGCCR
jgi:hypothetical protein